MDKYEFHQSHLFSFFILCILFILIDSSCIAPQYLLENTTQCVEKEIYPNYYIDTDNDNILKKCDYPCYECSKASDEINQNCLSCERGYEFDSITNSCIKCPKDKYKFIYNSYNTCNDANETYCKKEITKCTLLTEALFKGCPPELPVLIESKKMCVSKNACNSSEFLNGVCYLSYDPFKKSRTINPINFLQNEELKHKHNLGVFTDNNGNILFEACGDYDKQRFFYGIKKNGKANFTDEENKPNFIYYNISNNLVEYMKNNSFSLQKYYSTYGGNYIVSFSDNYFELIGFELNFLNTDRIKQIIINNLLESNKQMFNNYTISSTINTYIEYNHPIFKVNNLYIISFIAVNESNEYCLFIWIIDFYNLELNVRVDLKMLRFNSTANYKRTSLCVTESNDILSLYLNNDHELRAIFFKSTILTRLTEEFLIQNNSYLISDTINNNHYFSCFHLFEETIAIIFCKENQLFLSIKTVDSNDILVNYNDNFNNMAINEENKYQMSQFYYDNEVIKINNKKFVIFSKYENNEKLLIILCELYNQEDNIYKSINVRYYELSLIENDIEFNQFYLFLFNGLFGIYYYNQKTLFPHFFIFSYIRSEDPEEIDDLFNTNNNYTIKLIDYFSFENNLLGYEAKIKIVSLPVAETTGIYLYSSDYQQINENTLLDISDSITFAYSSESLISGDYNISFVPISIEPSSFSIYNFYSNDIKTFGEQISQENDYLNNIEEFEGEEAQFLFGILEDKSNFCDSSCKICNINQCFSCVNPNEYPAEFKTKCYSHSSPPTHYYFNETINVYLKCHENCDNCYGNYEESINNHNCINCNSGYIKMDGTNNCYPEDEDIYSYIKNEQGIFIRCDRHCETCSAPPTVDGYHNCISCDYEQNNILFNRSMNCLNCFYRNKIPDYQQKICIFESEIPDGYYLTENKIVEKCYKNCKTCSNGETYQKINDTNNLNMNCDSCDNDNNYYFIELANNDLHNCYSQNDIPQNYYKQYDSENNDIKYYKCHQLCASCNQSGTENDMNCNNCIDNEYELNHGNCFKIVDCLNYFIRNITNNNRKECINELCIEDYPFLIKKDNECKINCTIEQLISQECIPTKNQKIILQVYELIINSLKNKEICLDENNNFEDILINGIDSIYHLTTDRNLKDENKKKNSDLSHIEFGECEEKLKSANGLDKDASLFVFIVEIIINDTPTREVEYEIFNPDNLDVNLNLSVCKDIPISILSPITLDEERFKKYENAKNQGYDIYKSDDKFYNDICTPFDNTKNTDTLIEDRKKDYYEYINFCEDNCIYQGIDIQTRRVNCTCKVKTEMNLIDYFLKINFDPNEIIGKFSEVMNNSNLRILQCYKLAFNLEYFKSNVGSFIIIILSVLFLTTIFISMITLEKNVLNILNIISNNAQTLYEKQTNKKRNLSTVKRRKDNTICDKPYNPPKKQENKKKGKTTKIIYNNNNNIIINNIVKDKNDEQTDKTLKLQINRFKKKIFTGNNNFKSLLKESSKDISSKDNLKEKSKNFLFLKKERKNKIEMKNDELKRMKTKIKNKKTSKDKKNKNNKIFYSLEKLIKKLKPQEQYKYLIEEEINYLPYLEAIKIDYRTFWQYYLSLLKAKQLLLFTFLDNKDYNVKSVKFSFFILSFTVYFTINTFFFNDEAIHKLYENNGSSILVKQIIEIIYTSSISSIINLVIKYLCLTQNTILSIKNIYIQHIKKESKNIYKWIKTKIILFLLLGIIIFFFSWYYLSIFCCVYSNSQIHLFKSIVVSFIISMFYPIALSIIPTTLRIMSLREKGKKSYGLYNFSKLISFVI